MPRVAKSKTENTDEVKEKKTTSKAKAPKVEKETKPTKAAAKTVKTDKPAKEVKKTKSVKADKPVKEVKETKTAKTDKPAKEVKETKTVTADKSVKEIKETKTAKIDKPAKQPKEKKVKAGGIRFDGTGRRKKSIARVVVTPGSGNILVNGKKLNDYFVLQTLQLIVKQPFSVTNSLDKYDVICNVYGGGKSGQAGAIRHGISRSLLKANPEFKVHLKSAGFLTRDPRMKERKKYGLKKARKAPQFSKR